MCKLALCKVPDETSNIYFSLPPICFTKEELQKLEEAVNGKCPFIVFHSMQSSTGKIYLNLKKAKIDPNFIKASPHRIGQKLKLANLMKFEIFQSGSFCLRSQDGQRHLVLHGI